MQAYKGYRPLKEAYFCVVYFCISPLWLPKAYADQLALLLRLLLITTRGERPLVGDTLRVAAVATWACQPTVWYRCALVLPDTEGPFTLEIWKGHLTKPNI